VKGSVEKIPIRSLQLRHHRGAINTVPFGKIHTLANYSRDSMIMKLRFFISFGTDIEQVLKKVGQQLWENPEIGEGFIQPFKSQGILEIDDCGLVVRVKFMSKPGGQFVIQRYAYKALQKAFAENGIEFARLEIKVVTDFDDNEGPGTTMAASKQ
jgi:small-conductance mechanosensitive channel